MEVARRTGALGLRENKKGILDIYEEYYEEEGEESRGDDWSFVVSSSRRRGEEEDGPRGVDGIAWRGGMCIFGDLNVVRSSEDRLNSQVNIKEMCEFNEFINDAAN
ncbi:hypothetical protein Tco_1476571 [Tanacetum coccineum]